MRSLLAIIVLATAACHSSGSGSSLMCGTGTTLQGNECVQDLVTCGPGTHEDNGACSPDSNLGYVVRAPGKIYADGKRPVEIAAFGRKPDGTIATDAIVFNTDRPGAGVFSPATAVLGDLGAASSFTPCDSSVAGCLGTLGITIALASAPTTPIATFTVQLVAPPGIGPIDHCPAGSKILYLDGKQFVYGGKLTVSDATFTALGASEKVTFQIAPTDPIQGTSWSVEFDTVQLGQPMTAGVYEHAQEYTSVGIPGIDVKGTNPYSECPQPYVGEFQVVDYTYAGTVQHATIGFREWCPNYPDQVLSGCVHFE